MPLASHFIRTEIVKAGGGVATGLSAYIDRDARIDQNGERFNLTLRADDQESTCLLLPTRALDWAADAARVWSEAERDGQTIHRVTGETRWKKGGQVAERARLRQIKELRKAQELKYTLRQGYGCSMEM